MKVLPFTTFGISWEVCPRNDLGANGALLLTPDSNDVWLRLTLNFLLGLEATAFGFFQVVPAVNKRAKLCISD